MMKYISVVAILAALLVGCARAGDVVSPSTNSNLGHTQACANEGPYRLWGEWTWYFNADHDIFPDGTYRGVACLYAWPITSDDWVNPYPKVAYDVFDFTIDLD